MSRRPDGLAPLLGLVAVAASLGSGHVCARLAFGHGVGVLTAATVRSLCASLVLLALLAVQRTPLFPLHREFRATLLFGVLVVAQTLLIQLAVKLMPVTLAILVFYTYPFFTSVATARLQGNRMSGHLSGALVTAFVGLALVLGIGAAPPSPWGVLAGLGASLSFSTVLVLTPRLAPTLGAPLRTFYMMSTAAAVFVAVAGAGAAFRLPESPPAWIGLVGLAGLYGLGIVGLFLLLPRLGPVQTAVVLNLEPVFVAVVAWGWLAEGLAPVQIIGASLVVAAVIGYQVAERRRAQRAA